MDNEEKFDYFIGSEEKYEIIKIYDNGTKLVRNKVTNRYGILGIDNKCLIPYTFDFIDEISLGLFKVIKDGEEYYIDTAGNLVNNIGEFTEGLLKVKKDGEEYYIDPAGNIVNIVDSDKTNEQSTGKTL